MEALDHLGRSHTANISSSPVRHTVPQLDAEVHMCAPFDMLPRNCAQVLIRLQLSCTRALTDLQATDLCDGIVLHVVGMRLQHCNWAL